MKIDTKHLSEEQNEAVKLIGANIQVYGHYATYSCPDESEKAISKDITIKEFLNFVYDYYYTDRLNRDYGDDIKEQKSNKNFLKKRVNENSFNIGIEWIESEIEKFTNYDL